MSRMADVSGGGCGKVVTHAVNTWQPKEGEKKFIGERTISCCLRITTLLLRWLAVCLSADHVGGCHTMHNSPDQTRTVPGRRHPPIRFCGSFNEIGNQLAKVNN